MIDYNYGLKRFDVATMAATRAAWAEELLIHKEDVLESPYERILDWAEDHIDYTGEKSQTFAYGVFGGLCAACRWHVVGG